MACPSEGLMLKRPAELTLTRPAGFSLPLRRLDGWMTSTSKNFSRHAWVDFSLFSFFYLFHFFLVWFGLPDTRRVCFSFHCFDRYIHGRAWLTSLLFIILFTVGFRYIFRNIDTQLSLVLITYNYSLIVCKTVLVAFASHN